MKRWTNSILCLALLLLSVNCLNLYANHYTPLRPKLDRAPSPPLVYHGGDPDQDMHSMTANGYVLLGYSAFNGPMTSPRAAVDFGRSIGAMVVVIYSPAYTSSVSGSVPLVVPNPAKTSTSTVEGTVYGPGGSATSYTGTVTTTSPGGYTTYQLPYQVTNYNQSAAYFVKAR